MTPVDCRASSLLCDLGNKLKIAYFRRKIISLHHTTPTGRHDITTEFQQLVLRPLMCRMYLKVRWMDPVGPCYYRRSAARSLRWRTSPAATARWRHSVVDVNACRMLTSQQQDHDVDAADRRNSGRRWWWSWPMMIGVQLEDRSRRSTYSSASSRGDRAGDTSALRSYSGSSRHVASARRLATSRRTLHTPIGPSFTLPRNLCNWF